jgi:phage terminase large subunit
VSKEITINDFVPRWYQEPIFDALENKGYRKIIICQPRRSGKDLACWVAMIRQALQRVGHYYSVYPTYSQAKKALYDAMTIDGKKFIDYIPKELIKAQNSVEMKITLVNGSILQFVGSLDVNKLVGSNPIGLCYSEFALQDKLAYSLLRPIIAGNGGFILINSTPRGRNYFHELFKVAEQSDEWFTLYLTLDDTKHIPLSEIEAIIRDGEMSEQLVAQEFYCSWDIGISGCFYGHYIDAMHREERITHVPWEPSHPVFTSFDLGMRDNTTILFFQLIGREIRIIDCYENNSEGLEHYAKVLQDKQYIYGKHIAPHDIQVRELGTGMSRLDKARELGIRFTVAKNMPIIDGIEQVRTILPRTWIDQVKCRPLIKALENYKREYDETREVYKEKPVHDKFSHYADAMRYLALGIPRMNTTTSPEELDKRYQEAVYGRSTGQDFFNDPQFY